MQTLLLKPHDLNESHVAAWIPASCPECDSHLAITATTNGLFDKQNFSIVCPSPPGCGIEFPPDEILDKAGSQILPYLPDGESVGAEIFDRGREGNIVFGKGLGSNQSGKARSEQFRFAIDTANGWKWNAKKTNGPSERDRLYAMKATVGIFEDHSMKSALEMISRKIERIQRARHIKISEAMVDRISKLIRKGITNADARRPTTSRERRLIIENILKRMELWPP